MPGAPDPLYVAARRTLLDALGAVEEHLDDARSRAVTLEALKQIPEVFGRPNAVGCTMAARAAAPLEDPEVISAAAAALSGDLIVEVETRGIMPPTA